MSACVSQGRLTVSYLVPYFVNLHFVTVILAYMFVVTLTYVLNLYLQVELS